MKITIKDVANVANVSITTVSRVSNGSKGVSAKTRRRVLKAIKEMGYSPSAMASGLKTRLSKSIGIAVPDTIGDFYGEVINGIESTATENGYNLIISLNHHIVEEELSAVNFFKAKKVDGAVLVTTSGDDDYVHSLIEEGYNIVLLDRDSHGLKVDTVKIDNFRGGYIATEYLLNLGHSNILFIEGVPYIDSSKERFNGYKKALKDKGIKFNSDFILSGDFFIESGYLSIKKYLDKYGLNFSAIFASNDQMAMGAIKALNDKGISVPDEVSVIGFDDSYISPYIIPPLTTIKQRREEMGKVAAELLLDRIGSQNKKERTPRQVIIPVELIERESAIPISEVNYE
ncbi:MAG TPA: LacI family transcriptional regulator [Candidatus Atribacteria bacterium]|nr:MAG: Transcriptional regulator [Atribacteria bacterium 34_128]HAJ32414.1 LacI family transcriptional regulator [Candidatus Atribacteria bacterium]